MKLLARLLAWRPYIICNGDPRAAFNIAVEAALARVGGGVRTFHAFGVTVHWTFIGFIFCKHYPYGPPSAGGEGAGWGR